jgi:hypothetical protein
VSGDAGPGDRPALRVIDASATPEEVAAIVAALGAVLGSGADAPEPVSATPVSRWVHSARLRSRRTGASRGEWRLSGRIGRRARA